MLQEGRENKIDTFSHLAKTIESIKNLEPVRMSDDTMTLVKRIVRNKQSDININKWARKLATEVVRAND